jgi:N6-adenosine-specific RNA methylase IME4
MTTIAGHELDAPLELLPPYDDDIVVETRERIRRFGLGAQDAVITRGGRILLNDVVARACEELGVTPNYVEWNAPPDANPYEYVWRNVAGQRRLTREQIAALWHKFHAASQEWQRELQGREAARNEGRSAKAKARPRTPDGKRWTASTGEAPATRGHGPWVRTSDEVGRRIGTSGRSIDRVAEIIRKRPDMLDALCDGEFGTAEARRKIKEADAADRKPDLSTLKDCVDFFRLGLVDPPYRFPGRSMLDYPTEPDDWILALGKRMPEAAPDAILALCCTAYHLPLAFKALEAWEWKYTGIDVIWDKCTPGQGHAFMHQTEHILIASRGNARLVRTRRPDILRVHRTRRNSEKPDELYDLLRRAFPDAPRVDMFGRKDRPGWARWGEELKRDDD